MKPPCKPNGGSHRQKRPAHSYHTIDRRLVRGKCPYPDKWKSRLNRKVIWPPIDAHIFEGDNVCHTTCTCSSCSSSGQPPDPPDPNAPAPPDPTPPGQDGFASCDEDDDDSAIDCAVIAEPSDIFAPFSDLDTAEPSAVEHAWCELEHGTDVGPIHPGCI